MKTGKKQYEISFKVK